MRLGGAQKEVARILLRCGAEAWATNGAEQSLLQIATSNGHQSVVKLLEDEAHLNYSDSKAPTRRTTGSTLEGKGRGTSTPSTPTEQNIEQSIERSKSLLAELQSMYSLAVDQPPRDQSSGDLEGLLQMIKQQTSSWNLQLRLVAAREALPRTNSVMSSTTRSLRREGRRGSSRSIVRDQRRGKSYGCDKTRKVLLYMARSCS